DKAVAAPDPATATQAQIEAYEKHKQVVNRLDQMVTKLEVIRNLEDAAKRLDKDAEKQLAQVNGLPGPRDRVSPNRREDMSSSEGGRRADRESVFKGIEKLMPSLQAEQRDRVERARVMARGKALVGEMDGTIRTLRQGDFEQAAASGAQHAQEMKDIAAALRGAPADRVKALKEARDKVAKAIETQTKVNEQTPNKKAEPAEAKQNKELATEQAKAQFDARDARVATEAVAPDVAKTVNEAVEQEARAEQNLRENNPRAARDPQEKAIDNLQKAKDELDKK